MKGSMVVLFFNYFRWNLFS